MTVVRLCRPHSSRLHCPSPWSRRCRSRRRRRSCKRRWQRPLLCLLRPTRLPPRPSFPPSAPAVALVPALPSEGVEAAGSEIGPDAVLISSPFVGTFYRAASPENDPFVEIGQTIRKGQVVCIVEAMKLMNEIEAEFEGRIEEILVQNGEHVEYGQHLFRLSK